MRIDASSPVLLLSHCHSLTLRSVGMGLNLVGHRSQSTLAYPELTSLKASLMPWSELLSTILTPQH